MMPVDNLIVVTNYHKLLPTTSYHQSYQEVSWLAVIADEGQAFRNSKCKLYKKIMSLQCVMLIILTGV